MISSHNTQRRLLVVLGVIALVVVGAWAAPKWQPNRKIPKPYTNPVKEKLARGEPVFGGFVTIPSAKVIENLAVPGYLDFVWIEAEHTEFGPEVVQELTRACENEDLVPIVRVPKNDVDLVKKCIHKPARQAYRRHIGTGAMGVVVPSIRTFEEASYAVRMLKYPPEGFRPVGAERGNRYLARLPEYKAVANKLVMDFDPFLAELIAPAEYCRDELSHNLYFRHGSNAVRNIDEIVKIPGIDVLHIGPYDLSQDMGLDMNDPRVAQAVQNVSIAAQRAGIPLGGAAPTLTNALGRMQQGFRFFTVPGDMELLWAGINRYFSGANSTASSRSARLFGDFL